MAKRALLIGIDYYESMPDLSGCVEDATALRAVVQRNEDGSPNYDCRLLVNPGGPLITRDLLRAEWQRLFANFSGDILFYFAGHGSPTESGGALVTHEGVAHDPGLPMDDLLALANASAAQEVLLILDCCHSGSLGDVAPPLSSGRAPGGAGGAGGTGGTGRRQTAPPRGVERGRSSPARSLERLERRVEQQAQLREGVTILAASRSSEAAMETGIRGIFTALLLAALTGGAADVRGNVSAAAIYAFIEQALGAWDQRPLYKSYASTLAPVRRCEPHVTDTLLRQLPNYFASEDHRYQLDPTYEFTHPSHTPEHVAIFDAFKLYRDARLLRPVQDKDLYFAALNATAVALTPLGRFYWRLAQQGRI
jgi:hypothetical protein